jgi:acyl-CoA reductase-like NAD-dependent aldehyde dehydrogenase
MPGQTALVANLVSQIIAEVTSLPRGLVNIFTESGNTGAPYLVASPDVQVISYTGSTTVGRIVAANGTPTLKRMNLELGGKTPMIVFDDADLDSTVPLLAAGITTFGGEFCMTGSRILVQRGQPRDPGRHRLDEHLGGDQRRLRRGRLQAERHRPAARPAGDHRVLRSQDRRPRHPAAARLTPAPTLRRVTCPRSTPSRSRSN